MPRYELEKIRVRALVVSLADDLYGTFDSARYTAEHDILSMRSFLRPQ